MPKNAITDFLETINPEVVDIICPACGTPMGITQEGSYEMVLTVNARKEINDIISLYRRYLQGFERELNTLNIRGFNRAVVGDYPYTRERKDNKELKEGLYKAVGSKQIADFIDQLDYYQWYELLHLQLPPRSEFSETPSDYKKLINGVLEGFEPDLIIGPIMSLVLDQIKPWMNEIDLKVNDKPQQSSTEKVEENENKPEENDKPQAQAKNGNLDSLIEEVCPQFHRYFSLIRNLITEPELAKKCYTGDTKKLEEIVIRRLYILAILFGHKSKNAKKWSHKLIEPDIPFDLPKLVVVSPMRLRELVIAKVITRRKGFRWSETFINRLKDKTSESEKNTLPNDENSESEKDTPNGEKSESEDTLSNVIKLMQGEINNFAHFVCTGQSGSTPPELSTKTEHKTDSSSFYTGIKEQCGWYPKEELTHPVVLIGSPGTGKSTVMLTGLTTFYDNAQVLGIRVILTSNEDIKMVDQYTDNFWKGILPSPTKEGTRHSIQLTVESTSDVKKRTNFVFTDIPGEVAARSMKVEGTHPIVLGVLKHTETIIFFFDLSIEPSIRAALTHGKGNEEWGELQESFEQTVAERREDDNSEVETSTPQKSRAEISQIQLLGKLIQDLREIRDEKDMQTINFVCVIPKLDIFIADDEDEEKEHIRFLSGFCNELKKEGLLIQSRYTPDNETLKGLRSVGGAGYSPTLPKDKKQDKKQSKGSSNINLLDTQHKVILDISNKAIKYLKQIGDALGKDDDVEKADKTSLTNRIDKGLIETLQTVFGEKHVYLLPVSAQGNMCDKPEGSQDRKQFGHPPNQKLAEYVFITPVVLAMSPKTQ